MRKQKSSSAFGFDRYDKGRLERALAKATDTRLYIRLKAVLLIAQGMQVSEVAKLFDKSRRIVYLWVATYLKEHQPLSLEEGTRSGRPLAAPGITDTRILKELKRNPLKLGYQTTVWTVEVLARHLSCRYGCEIRPFTLYRRMKAMGLRSKRPRYVYSEKDPHRAQKKGQ
jgi:transposase